LTTTGKILAICTDEGCTIFVYNTDDGSAIKELYRGTIPRTFNYIKFQLDDTRLLVASESGTIHIFCYGWRRRKK
jgi:WD40 repeat protein